MRRDTRVMFKAQDAGEITMNEEGNFERGDITEWVSFAHVSDFGAERQRMMFGDVLESRLVIRILQEPPFKPDEVIVDGKYYHIERELELRNKSAYIVSGA